MRLRLLFKRFRQYFLLLVLVNVLLLSTLSLWLTPTREQWFPKHLLNKSKKEGKFVQRFPSPRANLNRTLVILLWTEWFADPYWAIRDVSSIFSSCPVSDCVITVDKSDIVRADAVLFHAWDLRNIFVSYSLPAYRREDQVWILVNVESPPNPPIYFENYNNVFNWTATYRYDSDITIRYFKTTKLTKHGSSVGDIAATKSAGIAWVASNCKDDARRQMLVREISKNFPVDSYGSCGSKILPDEEMGIVLKKYKFYLAFENSYCRDYITEKFLGAIQHQNIPIVAGGGDYKSSVPPGSYIDVMDFNSVQDLTEYLRYLDRNNTAYNRYFDWTKNYKVEPRDRSWCRICDALHDERRPSQVYTDMVGYVEDDSCLRYTLPRHISRMVQGYAIKAGLI